MNNYVLSNFKPHYLSEPVPQEKSLQFTASVIAKAISIKENIRADAIGALCKKVEAAVVRFGVKPEYINQRRLYFYDALEKIIDSDRRGEEMLPQDVFENLFSSKADVGGKTLAERMGVFDEVIFKAFTDMYINEDNPPKDIIHVSCSGYVSPSPAQRLVSVKAWYDTTVTNSYHMGCYGAVPAMRMAVGFMSSSEFMRQVPKKRIDSNRYLFPIYC
mgnify:FL=1